MTKRTNTENGDGLFFAKKQKDGYDTEEARSKNKEEYNDAADEYAMWCSGSVLMQEYCYHSTIEQIEKQVGIKGKSFMEVGCGPCPIGQKLVARGAAKIVGVDISDKMIDNAREGLTKLGIVDKFELLVADCLDPNFILEEKVDCVVLSYAMTTFINSVEMLKKLLSSAKNQIKEGGAVFIADFSYVNMFDEGFWAGMRTDRPTNKDKPIEPFEVFEFYIDRSASPFQIFHIPHELVFKMAYEVGLTSINFTRQYPSMKAISDPIVVRYVTTCNPTDYLMCCRVEKTLAQLMDK